MTEMITIYYNDTYYQVVMPILADSKAVISYGNPFVKFISTPGVAYVQIDKTSETIMEGLVKSILGVWPLLAIAILLSINSGALIWILVRDIVHYNFAKILQLLRCNSLYRYSNTIFGIFLRAIPLLMQDNSTSIFYVASFHSCIGLEQKP